MTNKEAYENIGLALKCYLPDNLSKDTKDELQESWDIIRKDLEILQIIKEHLHIYENDDFAMYWCAGSSDSEYEKYNEEENRKKERVIKWWKEWYYPNYERGE